MRFKFIILLIFINLTTVITAQNNPTLFSVNKRKIGLNDFKLDFNHRYGADKWSDKQLVRDFLNERVNFVVQAQEAKSLRLNRTNNFQQKLFDFKTLVIESHITDNYLLEKLTKEAYQRMQTEIEIMQMLFRVSEFATPEDTLLAYNKAMAVRRMIVSGENFAELSKRVSDAPFSAFKGGDKVYVSALSLPYKVENYIYNTRSSTCSYPIRSHEGYHLIKVLGRRKNPGYFKVSHILVRLSNDSNASEVRAAKQKINDIYNKYRSGTDFNTLAEQYSDDVVSFEKSRPLIWLSSGMMPAEFANKCMSLRNGEISRPFKTRFGWHIIKKNEQQNLSRYEVVKEQLEHKIMSDNRSKIVKKQIIDNLKRKYGYKDYHALKPIIEVVNDTIFYGKWIIKGCDGFKNKLCKINNQTYYQKDFIKYLQNNQEKQFPIPVNTYVDLKYNDFVSAILLENEAKYIEKNNREISKALQNYEDMLLVAILNEQKSVGQSKVDDIDLERYYDNNKSKYNQSHQVDMSIFSYSDNIKKVEKLLRKLKSKNASDQEIVARIKASKDMSFKLDERIVAKEGENMYVDNVVGLYKAGKLNFDDKSIVFAKEKKIVWLNSRIQKTNIKFEDVREKLIDDYKKYRAVSWIDDIKRKHRITINDNLIF